MSERFELLAPGGDLESIKAAIAAGADAVYCGLDKFNARNRADNLDWEGLNGVIRLAHQHGTKIFLTLNIIMLPAEFPQLWKLLNQLQNSAVDGVIVQDLGLFGLIKRHFPSLDIHASTQNNTHNWGQIEFLRQFGISRVNLSRELSLDEIKPLASYGAKYSIQMEVFVHGSYCVGFSGLCYLSSHHNGCSGNRGRCSQPCRDGYQTTAVGLDFPLNMKDNNAFADIDALADAGVYSVKVEGRIKKSHYVFAVVDQWRQQIDQYCQGKPIAEHSDLLYTVFNRDFSAGYLHGEISRDMFIDNSRDNSARYFAQRAEVQTEAEYKAVKRRLYDVKTDIIEHVQTQIAPMDIGKQSLSLALTGELGQPLQLTLIKGQGAAAKVWHLSSQNSLTKAVSQRLDESTLTPFFKPLNDANHQLAPLQLIGLGNELNLPFTELTQLRKQLLLAVRGGKPKLADQPMPAAPTPMRAASKRLAVLLNQTPSAELLAMDIDLYYQVPEGLAHECSALIALFERYPKLQPYFPAILIGENFEAAKRLLQAVNPKQLITNNSGVAVLAQQLGIQWVAGPYFNLTNGYAFEVLQQQFECAGGFLSNELNRPQLKRIGAPTGMNIYYSLYHPQALLTSRQCLIQQSVGCRKTRFTRSCLRRCDKIAPLVNLKQAEYIIDKQHGDHNVIYAAENYLNLGAVEDLVQVSHGFVDLRAIATATETSLSSSQIAALFLAYITGEESAKLELQQMISNTDCRQYRKGL